MTYGSDAADAMGDAASAAPYHLLNGTIINSGPTAVIQLRNL